MVSVAVDAALVKTCTHMTWSPLAATSLTVVVVALAKEGREAGRVMSS